jgi:5-methylcytosine-specific restriction endonuclease McrA
MGGLRSPRGHRVQAWYRSKGWKRLRAKHLKQHPHCQCPHCAGKYIPANVVHHIKPHRGNEALFWDEANLQSLTTTCHDRFKQSQEKGGHGFLKGCDQRGYPLSKDHPWYESR